MANFKWSLTFQDGDGNRASCGGYYVGADLAAAEAYLQGVAEALNDPTPAGAGALPLTLGVIVEATLTSVVDFSGWALRATVGAGAENQKGGRFIFRAGGSPPTKITVPTFNEALKVTGGYIDITNLAVISFFDTAVIDNGGADNRFDDITTLDQAYFTYGGKPAYS